MSFLYLVRYLKEFQHRVIIKSLEFEEFLLPLYQHIIIISIRKAKYIKISAWKLHKLFSFFWSFSPSLHMYGDNYKPYNPLVCILSIFTCHSLISFYLW